MSNIWKIPNNLQTYTRAHEHARTDTRIYTYGNHYTADLYAEAFYTFKSKIHDVYGVDVRTTVNTVVQRSSLKYKLFDLYWYLTSFCLSSGRAELQNTFRQSTWLKHKYQKRQAKADGRYRLGGAQLWTLKAKLCRVWLHYSVYIAYAAYKQMFCTLMYWHNVKSITGFG